MIRGLNKIIEAGGLGYMMSSYTAHPGGCKEAEKAASIAAADLLSHGLVIFAPIVYGPPIERVMLEEPRANKEYIQSHEFWMAIDERFFERCDYGILAMTPGWHKSTGIAIEVYALAQAGIPIYFYEPNEAVVYTLDEVGERWDAEMTELIDRSSELGDKHLSTRTKRYVKNMAEVIGG